MPTLEDRIENFIREYEEQEREPPTVRTISAKLKVRQREVLETVQEAYRFNVNVALATATGYADLKPADYTVEVMRS